MIRNLPLIDSSFHPELLPLYEISIQLKLNGYSLFIKDHSSSKFIYFDEFTITDTEIRSEEYRAEYYCQYLSDFLDKQNFPKKQFRKVSFLFHQPEVFLLPNPFYASEKNDLLFAFQFPDLKDGFVEENPIQTLDARVQFAIPDCLYRILTIRFGEFNAYHALSRLLCKAIRSDKLQPEAVLFLEQQDTIAHIAGFSKKQLIIAQSFTVKSKEDIIYTLGNILHQIFPLETSVDLIYGGSFIDQAGFLDWANAYFAQCSPWYNEPIYPLAASLSEIPSSKYHLLLNPPSCE